jgi:hypothetical protein
LTALLSFLLPGCDNPDPQEPLPPEASVQVDDRVLFEQEGIRVTLDNIDNEDLLYRKINLYVESNAVGSMDVEITEAAIDGIAFDPEFKLSIDPGNGVSATAVLEFPRIEGIQVETGKELKLSFILRDSKNQGTAIDPVAVELGGKPIAVQEYIDKGTVLVDKDGIKLVALTQDEIFLVNARTLVLYFENNTGEPGYAYIDLLKCKINGKDTRCVLLSRLSSGGKMFDELMHLSADAEISTIEFELRITDFYTGRDLIEPETVKLQF